MAGLRGYVQFNKYTRTHTHTHTNSFERKTRRLPDDVVRRVEQGTRDGEDETVAGTRAGAGMSTRAGMGARRGAGTGTRIEMRVEGSEREPGNLRW